MTTQVTGVKQILSLDLRSLALYRVFLGVILFLDSINRMLLVPAFYADSGIVPRSMVNLEQMEHAYHLQILFLKGSEWYAYLFLCGMAICSISLIIGFRTRIVTVLCWFLFCSLNLRNGLILHAGDTLLTLLLFWGMFLPLGRTFSIDSWRMGCKQSGEGPFFSAATVGLYIQFMLIYIMNGLYKGQYLAWIDGTHLYNTFSRFELIKPFALFLYPHYDLLTFLTQFSLFLELFGPLLFLIPIGFVFFRMAGILFFLGLQLSILLTLNIGLFPLVSMTGILVFLPTGFWNFIGGRFTDKLERLHVENRNTGNTISKKSMALEIIIVMITIYILAWNIFEYSSQISMSDKFKTPGYYLKLDQRWALFASPEKKSEYLSVNASYEDGTSVDLMQDLKTSMTFNQMRYARYDNYRWRVFFTKHVGDPDKMEFMPKFINYLIAEYSPEESKGKKIERVDIIPHMHYIGDNYDLTPVQTDIIYTMNIEE